MPPVAIGLGCVSGSFALPFEKSYPSHIKTGRQRVFWPFYLSISFRFAREADTPLLRGLSPSILPCGFVFFLINNLLHAFSLQGSERQALAGVNFSHPEEQWQYVFISLNFGKTLTERDTPYLKLFLDEGFIPETFYWKCTKCASLPEMFHALPVLCFQSSDIQQKSTGAGTSSQDKLWYQG